MFVSVPKADAIFMKVKLNVKFQCNYFLIVCPKRLKYPCGECSGYVTIGATLMLKYC